MKFYLDTDHPIALDSPDHIEPRSTARDNSVNLKFNVKLRQLFTGYKASVLDLGCAGGGMVRSLIEEGHVAVGLEGSDYNLLHQRAEWATISESLFTCDVTKPFILHVGNGLPYQFDVVTAWEFFEHIREEDMPGLFNNIHDHLKQGGLLIGSICKSPSIWDKVDHHQTKAPWAWWEYLFNSEGFSRRPDFEAIIGKDWVRSVHFNFVMQGWYGMAYQVLNPMAAKRLDALVA